MLQFSLLVIAVQRIGEVQEKLRTFGQLRSQLLLDLRDKQQALTVDSRIANGGVNLLRSRLYRNEILQVNMRLKALAEIYTMHSFAQL